MKLPKHLLGLAATLALVISSPAQAWVMSMDYFGVFDNISVPAATGNTRVDDHFTTTQSYTSIRGNLQRTGDSYARFDAYQGSLGTSQVSGNQRYLSRARMTGSLLNSSNFAVGGIFDLVAPDKRGRYGIRLNDAGSSAQSQQIDLGVRMTKSGLLQAVFQYDGDRAQNGFDMTQAINLTPTLDQIAMLMYYDADLGTVRAGFFQMTRGFLDGKTATELRDIVFGTGTTWFANGYQMFNGEDFVRAEFFATQVVPEPSTWLMMLAGLGLLIGIRKRVS
jgi:hypothetical protein